MSETKVPAIPPVPTNIDPSLLRFLAAIKEVVQVREGNKGDALDANVTFRDLVNAGIATASGYTPDSGTGSPVSPGTANVDPCGGIPPPRLTNVTVSSGVGCVFVTWKDPAYKCKAFIEVFRGVGNTFSENFLIGKTSGNMFVDYVADQNVSYRYWVRVVSQNGTKGQVHEIEGTPGTATLDPDFLRQRLETQGGTYDPNQPYFHVPDSAMGVDPNTGLPAPGINLEDGTLVPPGFYLWNATVSTASIRDAAITNAKIANLSADKIEFNEAKGEVFSAAVITGGLIKGTNIVGNDIEGGSIHGARIWSGGSTDHPNIEMNAEGVLVSKSQVKDETNPDSYDYVEVNSGDVTSFFYIDNYGHVPSKSLSRVEFDSNVENGAEVLIPGFWVEEPRVMVSPASINVYNPSYKDVTQTLLCSASNKTRQSDSTNSPYYYAWKFTPKAELVTTNGVTAYEPNATLINNISNTPPAGTVTSGTFSFPAQVESVSFTVSASMWLVNGFFEAGNYVSTAIAEGQIVAYFQVQNGSNWTTIYTSPVFDSDSSASLAAGSTPPKAVSRTFTFTPTVNTTATSCRIVLVYKTYDVAGSTVTPLNVHSRLLTENTFRWLSNDYNTGTNTRFAGVILKLAGITLNTTGSSTLADGTLNWIAVGR